MTLEVRAATFAYASQTALRDVSFSAGQGQLIALTGENGSGKSTLLRILARVVMPHAGDAYFEQRALRDWNPRQYAQRVAYLPQEPDATFPMRALDAVVSGRAPFLERFEWEDEADFAIARDALAMCDASHLAERYLDEMSGGERKRVFLARVLAGKPKLILLDEPLTALDVAHVQQFSRLLRDIVDTTGATVIFASHDLNWAAAYSDRMLVMKEGRLGADIAAADLTADLVRQFFGYDAAAVSADGRVWLVPRV